MLMWLKVKLDNGKIGYVFGSHLQIESPEKIDFSQPMTQNGKAVQPTKNLSPSTNANTSNTSNNELKIKVGTITGNDVNVRKGPSIDYTSLGVFFKGDKVRIVDSNTNSLNETWYKIEFDNPKVGLIVGWVRSDFIKIN